MDAGGFCAGDCVFAFGVLLEIMIGKVRVRNHLRSVTLVTTVKPFAIRSLATPPPISPMERIPTVGRGWSIGAILGGRCLLF
jgi:hypothetical protein